MTLTREQILAARSDRKPVRLEVPEWGGEVYVRVLSAKDQMRLSDGGKPEDLPVRVLLYALVDENNIRIFGDDDLDELAAEDFTVIMKVFSVVATLNGLSNKELEAAVESFSPAPDESSSTE